MEAIGDYVQNMAASMAETAAAMENVVTGSRDYSFAAGGLRETTERFKVERR